MPYKTEYLSGKKVIVQECWGKIDLRGAKKAVKETVDYITKYDVCNLLLDDVKLKTNYNVTKAYDFGANLLEKAGHTRRKNIAVVHPRGDQRKKDYLSSETLYRDKGWNYRVFASRNAALKWLKAQ